MHLHLNAFQYNFERLPSLLPCFQKTFSCTSCHRKDDFHRRSRLSPIFPLPLLRIVKEKERMSVASLRLSLEREMQYSETGVGIKIG